jgi:hypothetical protein
LDCRNFAFDMGVDLASGKGNGNLGVVGV